MMSEIKQYTPKIQYLDDDELLSRLILAEKDTERYTELRQEVLRRMSAPNND